MLENGGRVWIKVGWVGVLREGLGEGGVFMKGLG